MRATTLQVSLAALLSMLGTWAWAGHNPPHPSTDDFPSDVALAWFETLYDVVKAEETAPPPASRIYGISAVALYEAVVAGTRTNRSLIGQLNGLSSLPQPHTNKQYHWPTVANAALFATIRGLYPTISKTSLRVIKTSRRAHALPARAVLSRPVYRRSVAHGRAVAAAILDWAAADGYASHTDCPYFPLTAPGAWKPTPPLFGPTPVQPCWGMIRPMVLISGEECAAPGHPAFSTERASDFYAAAQEVYDVSLALSDEQKLIADYWADGAGATGTPSGHWIAILSQLVDEEGLSLAAAAEAYARVGIAAHDAFITCWNTKYAYNLQRPVTYIKDHIDAGWLPYIATPGFPSYTSGHATVSGAAAYVLTELFGIQRFTDSTHADHGLTSFKARTFDSFEEAAAEAAVSRLYGGIHYTFDNRDGLAAGRCIGQAIRDRLHFENDGAR